MCRARDLLHLAGARMRLIAAGLVLAIAVGMVLAVANLPGHRLPNGATSDRVVVHKAERTMQLMRGHDVLAEYRIALGREPLGPKRRQGDGRTPEGRFTLDFRNPNSRYHLSLHVSYSDAADRARALEEGVDPGGDIMIHGLPNGLGWIGRLHRLVDWTEGCVAVTDAEIEQIWRAVPDGTPIEILPDRP